MVQVLTYVYIISFNPCGMLGPAQNASLPFSFISYGENLSPLLFAFYVNDLQEKLIEFNCNYLDFDNQFLNVYLKLLVLIYADDTVLLCESEANMKQALTALHRYCSEWKLKVM